MKLTAWILLVLALLVLGALGGLMLSGGRGEPRDLLESALRRFNGPEQDTETTLKELELALRAAEAEGDADLAADVLIARGRVLRDVGAFGPARADLERALERYRPGSVDIELELVAIDEETGELRAGIERARRITDRDPEQLEAWTYAGQLLVRISEERLEEVRLLCEANMSDEDAARAFGHAQRAAGMNVGDPLRVSQLAGMRSLFDPPDHDDSLRSISLVEQASEAAAMAREALVRAFSGQLERESVQSYFELLARSGRTRDAVDFGLAVVPHKAANASPQFMERLARILIDAGRPRAAGEVILQNLNRQMKVGRSYYSTLCEALFEAQRWNELHTAATLYHKALAPEYSSLATFYMGMARGRLNNVRGASAALDMYTRREPIEAFPGALPMAWRTLAAAWRTQGEIVKENTALREAVRLDPEGDGESWLRLFHILQEREPQALTQAEQFLTHAMCLMPQRTGELMPTWIDIGKRRLRAAGTDLEQALTEPGGGPRPVPSTKPSPYELFRFGEMYRDAREHLAAAACMRRLLAAYPGFLPAIDLLAESERELGDWPSAARLWLERVRLAGSDPATLRRLARMPPGTLTPAQWIEWMQLDPENTGRLEVARTLQAEGRPHAALAGLDALPLEPLGDDGLLLAAELLIEVGKPADALAMIARLRPERREGARAFLLSLEAATLLGREDGLLEIIAAAPKDAPLMPALLVKRIDVLLARGMIAPARALLDLLDSRPESRSGDVLLRRAGVALLERDPALVQDELDRAEAFDRTGAVALGRVLAVIESRIYNRLPIHVRALFDTPFQPTRRQAAILAILDERVEDARRMISTARREDPRDPHWALLEASLDVLEGRTSDLTEWIDPASEGETLYTVRGGERNRDPRPLYARLLALDTPEWRLWAVAELSRQKPVAPGSLWANYLAGRGLAEAGLPLDAERAWRLVLRSWPTFEPAWEALEEVKRERLGRPDHVELVKLREDRRKASGRRPGEEAEEQLTEAWAREAAGNWTGALESAQRAVESDPSLAPAWLKLGQLSHRAGDWEGAIAALRKASSAAEGESDSPTVAEFVEVLASARAAGPALVPAAMVRSELAELATRYPDDPLIPLAQARAELDQEDIAPAVRVARAYQRLDAFLARLEREAKRAAPRVPPGPAAAPVPAGTGANGSSSGPSLHGREPGASQRSLESLRAGSTSAWKDFYESLEPARAESFVRTELHERPGSLELWRMLGETLAAQDRPAEAIRLYELVSRMVPDGRTHRALARLYAETGAEPAKVEAAIAAAVRLEGRKAPDLDLQYAQALALVAHPAGQARGLQLLAGMWQRRDTAVGVVRDVDIGQLYGTTLVQRGDPSDRQLASGLLREVVAAIQGDPARKNLVEALAALAAQIPARTR